jgi:hypothetical protein
MRAGLNPTNNAPPGANDGIKTGRAILLHAAIFLNLCGKAVIALLNGFGNVSREIRLKKACPKAFLGRINSTQQNFVAFVMEIF